MLNPTDISLPVYFASMWSSPISLSVLLDIKCNVPLVLGVSFTLYTVDLQL